MSIRSELTICRSVIPRYAMIYFWILFGLVAFGSPILVSLLTGEMFSVSYTNILHTMLLNAMIVSFVSAAVVLLLVKLVTFIERLLPA